MTILRKFIPDTENKYLLYLKTELILQYLEIIRQEFIFTLINPQKSEFNY